MARDEARIDERGERALRRRDVGDDHVRPGRVERLAHDGGSGADRNRDDDEIGVRDRLRERRHRFHGTACRCPREHAAICVEPATARPVAAGGEGDGRPHEPGADDGEALDGPLPLGRRRGSGRCRGAPIGRDLLLQHVEDRREDRPDASFRKRPGVGRDERLQQLRLALGIDPPFARRVLVAPHGRDELEAAVERLEQRAVERLDLGAEV